MRTGIWTICVLLVAALLPNAIALSEESAGVVFEAGGNLILKQKDKVIWLTFIERDSDPALSPDGRWVVFSREVPRLAKACTKRKRHL